MKRIALLAALITLASCSSKGPDDGSLGNEQAKDMFKEAMSQPPVPQSVMRNGDRLSFMLLQPKSETSPFGFLLQVDAACSSPSVSSSDCLPGEAARCVAQSVQASTADCGDIEAVSPARAALALTSSGWGPCDGGGMSVPA